MESGLVALVGLLLVSSSIAISILLILALIEVLKKNAENATLLAENEILQRKLMDINHTYDISDASTTSITCNSTFTKIKTESLFSHLKGKDCCKTYFAPTYCSTNPGHEKFW